VHFSMKSFLVNQAGMNDALVAGPYELPALVPASPWLSVAPAPQPIARLSEGGAVRGVILSTTTKLAPWQWLVRARTDTGWISELLPGDAKSWLFPEGTALTVVSVTALNRAGAESAPVFVTPTARPSTSAPAKRGREHED